MNPSRQNHPDKGVATLLDALRNAEIPPGMEARILNALERSTEASLDSEQAAPAPHFSRRWLRRPEFAFSLAAIALLALALGLRTTSRHAPAAQPSAASTSSPDRAPRAHTRFTPADQSSRRPEPHSRHPSATASYAATRDAAARQPDSFPAPEAPLTAQERLLLQIIHQGDPLEIAALNSGLRDAEAADDAAEFEDFFKPKPTVPPPINPIVSPGVQDEPVRP